MKKNYAALLELYGISAEEVLRRARLPLDLFAHEAPSVNEEEYYRFMAAIDETVDDNELPIRLAGGEHRSNIVPHKVMVKRPFENSCYEKFLGVEAETGEKNALIFTEQDAHVPFVTHNESMWSFF